MAMHDPREMEPTRSRCDRAHHGPTAHRTRTNGRAWRVRGARSSR